MKRLIREYQHGESNLIATVVCFAFPMTNILLAAVCAAGGPCWLVRELSARGLQWEAICDVQDKLTKEELTTPETFAHMPLLLFNHGYLERIGIASLHVRQVLLQLRLQCTWLGMRLTAAGMRPESIEPCEHVVLQRFGCDTEAAFARVLPEELSDESLARVALMAAPVRRCLRVLHADIIAEQAALRPAK